MGGPWERLLADRTLDRPAVLVAAASVLLVAPAAAWLLSRNPTPIAGLFVAVALSTAALRFPSVAFYGLIGTMLLNKQEFVHLGFAYLGPHDLLAIFVVPAWAVSRFIQRKPVQLPVGWPLALVYLTLCTLSLTVSHGSVREYGAFARFILALLTGVAICDQIRTWERAKTVLLVIAAIGIGHAFYALAIHDTGRLVGWVDQSNITGRVSGTCVFAALAALQIARTRRDRIIISIGIAGLLMAIVLTLSRGTWLALGLTLAITWWRRPMALLGIGALAAAGLLYTNALEGQTERLMRERLEARDRSVSQRADTLRNGLRVISEYPLLGVGFNQFRELDRRVEIARQPDRSAHNYYLQTAAETGIPSLAIFLMMWGLIYLRIRARRIAAVTATHGRAREKAAVLQGYEAMIIFNAGALATGGMHHSTMWSMVGLMSAVALVPLLLEQDATADTAEGPEIAPRLGAPSPGLRS